MRLLAPAVASLILGGCAYVGEPLPPALNIPERVLDLTAVQRGDKVYVNYTAPKVTTEGLVIDKLAPADLRAGDIPVAKVFEAAPFAGQTVEIHVRFAGPKGRLSDWSNAVRLAVVAPLSPPANVQAAMAPDGARIAWNSPAKQFRIFRDGEPLAVASASPYIDKTVEIGKSYRYAVQALQSADAGAAESEMSPTLELEARDTFAPATPARFTAIAGVASVELSWEAPPDADVASYNVYRDDKRAAEHVTARNYSDTQVQHGARYRYAVTAVDRAGNESVRTPIAEIQFP